MSYHLPTYPSSRLDTLVHLDTIARSMIAQHDHNLTEYDHCGIIIPRDSILHTGSMVMSMIKLITSHHPKHYVIMYDPALITNHQEYTLLDDNMMLTTNFGHRIMVEAPSTQLPHIIEQLCCMISIYQSVTHITVMHHQDQHRITDQHTMIWIAGNLHHDLHMDIALAQDEKVLTRLTLGQVDDTTLISYNILHTLWSHYRHQEVDYNIIPVSYHNTALLDGHKESTSSYCAALIIKE